MKNTFVQGFVKIAVGLPKSFHKMHQTLKARKNFPGYSAKKVSDMLKRRAVT